MARTSGGRGGRDRQRADGAVPLARGHRGGGGKTRSSTRLSGRLCRRRRGQSGARRCWPGYPLRHIIRPPRRERARRRCGQRACEHRVKSWLAVVGIGEDGLAGLAPAGRALVETAQVLVGGGRHLGMVPASGAERLLWERPLDRTIAAIAARRGCNVTVLASGDPLWYGVAVTLIRRFPPEEMTIVPRPSAFSLAAARLGWPVADCAIEGARPGHDCHFFRRKAADQRDGDAVPEGIAARQHGHIAATSRGDRGDRAVERTFPEEPLGATRRYHAEMSAAADQHLRGLDQRAPRRGEAG